MFLSHSLIKVIGEWEGIIFVRNYANDFWIFRSAHIAFSKMIEMIERKF
jgi:hypothetical protein